MIAKKYLCFLLRMLLRVYSLNLQLVSRSLSEDSTKDAIRISYIRVYRLRSHQSNTSIRGLVDVGVSKHINSNNFENARGPIKPKTPNNSTYTNTLILALMAIFGLVTSTLRFISPFSLSRKLSFGSKCRKVAATRGHLRGSHTPPGSR
jgi:hypothetical protein